MITTEMKPFAIFQIYHAVFLHYTTSYDFQKYSGGTSYTEEAFDRRRDKYSYHKLAREYASWNPNEFAYLTSWLFYRQEKWVNSKTYETEAGQWPYEWRNYGKQRELNFRLDMVKIRTFEEPKIFEKLNQGDLHYASLFILDRFTNIIDVINTNLTGNFLWDQKYKKLIKFLPFYFQHEPVDDSFKQFIPENLQCLIP
jgi:hypothetical protein